MLKHRAAYEDIAEHLRWCNAIGSPDPVRDAFRFINTFAAERDKVRLIEAVREKAGYDKR